MIKKSYSYDYWIIDDSVNVNVYNKPLFVCMVRDEYGTSQILFFGYLFDKKEESFNVIFDNVKEYLPALPKIIISDRDNAQFNSVKSKFPSSLVIFCLVHIFRNLNKFFSKNHLVIRLFRYVQMGWIPEEFFLKCIDIIVNNNIENDEEGTNEEENNWYEILNEEDGDILSSNELKKLLEESKSCKINKGIKCIKLLIEQREHWIRSVYIKNGIYHEKTSNRAESFFGNLKVSIKHKKLLLFKLTEIIIGMANGKRNVVKYTELNDRILKKEYHENITYMGKEIMNKQIMLLIEGKYKDNSSTCRSCLIRKECPALSWPCVHMMKDKIGNGEYILTYDELPLITKKRKDYSIDIKYKFNGKKDLEVENERLDVLRNVAYVKQSHNNNLKSTTLVENKVRKRSKKNICIEIISDEDWKFVRNKKRKKKEGDEEMNEYIIERRKK